MKDDINKALEVLRKGGVILYPTDTIWGIGCDATNNEAVSRIFDIKKRNDNKSLIVLLDTPARIAGYVDEVPDVAYQLMDLADRPLTLILEGAKNLAKNVINSSDLSIGLRVANDPFCQQLINRFRKPIVSTSANISGEQSPKSFIDINDEIKNQVDYIVNHRQNDMINANPSSIIKIRKNGEVQLIRK